MTPRRHVRWLLVLALALVASFANAEVSVPAKLQAQPSPDTSARGRP